MSHFYTCFGLAIQSELPIPGITEIEPCAVDINISTGEVVTNLLHPIKSRPEFEVGEDRVLLRPKDSKRILIENGQSITIEENCKGAYSSAIPYILGSALGAILQQRQKFVLHASAITNDIGSILICGKSGQGKSTTTTELLHRAYKYTSDDISSLSMSPTTALVNSAYPQLRLWDTILDKYSFSAHAKQLVKEEGTSRKYALPCEMPFCSHPNPVLALIFLSRNPSSAPQIEQVYGKDVFAILRNNIYRKAFLAGHRLQHNMLLIEQFARLVPTYQITRPQDKNTIVEVGDLVDKLFKELSNNFQYANIV